MAAKWSRTPKHIMRRKCIEYVIKNWKPASFIEFGAGTGDMTTIFLETGYQGFCYDIGEATRQVLRHNLQDYVNQVTIIDDLETIVERQFDYLFAFEVLEHIQDDVGILREWSRYLKTGGKLLVSVPAHQNKYSQEDEAVGHVRRYDKQQLIELLEKTGYHAITVLNHGFPLGNFTRIVSNLLHRSKKNHLSQSLEERSVKSGVERLDKVNKLSFLFNDLTMAPFNLLQIPFFHTDWGDGYVAYAEKRV